MEVGRWILKFPKLCPNSCHSTFQYCMSSTASRGAVCNWDTESQNYRAQPGVWQLVPSQAASCFNQVPVSHTAQHPLKTGSNKCFNLLGESGLHVVRVRTCNIQPCTEGSHCLPTPPAVQIERCMVCMCVCIVCTVCVHAACVWCACVRVSACVCMCECNHVCMHSTHCSNQSTGIPAISSHKGHSM